MSATLAQVSFAELLANNESDAAKWRKWFDEQSAAVLDVRLSIALLRREDAVNNALKVLGIASIFEKSFVDWYLFERVLVILDNLSLAFASVQQVIKHKR